MKEATFIMLVCTILYCILKPIIWLKNHYSVFAIILLLSLPFNGFSQTFLGVEGGNKGAGVNVGIVSSGLELKAGFNMSLYRSETPALFYATAGYQIKLTNNEEDNWSLTPSIGIGHSSYEDFTEYNKGGEILKVKEFLPKYGFEIGKDKHIGRIYVAANYAKYMYYNIGIRAYIK